MFGGDKRDRTADLLNAIQALSQAVRVHTPVIGVWEMHQADCIIVKEKHIIMERGKRNTSAHFKVIYYKIIYYALI